MKKTLLFLFILFTVASSAQDYKKEWAVVLEKEADGEIKQAAALTDIIYTKAQRKKNQPQVLKAFFFKAKYMQVIEEDAQFKIISNIQADITKTPFPAKAILKSLYAQMLEKIYSKNRYSIGQISNTSNYDKYNYRKWSSQNFVTEIEKAYKESLEPADLLYKTPLTVFEEIIDLSPSLRETKRPLYDFLAEQYLNYLCGSTTINYDYYKKNLPMLFGTTEQFLQLKTNDSLTHALGNTLTLLCELENHYLKEQDIQNLSIATLRRLERLDRNIYLNEKNSIYLATVKDLYSKSSKTAASYPVRFTQAQLLIRMADKKLYNSNINEALAICNELITTREKHDLGADAANLKTNYLRKEATIKFDDLIKPNTPSLAHVNYKNLDSVTIAFYKIPYNANTRDSIVRNTYIKSKIPVLKKAYVLPVKKDHFEYNTEIILPPLAKGTYAVVILPTEEAKPDKSSLVEKINVSQIAMVEQKDNNQAFYDIVDRFSGKPIDKAKAIVKNFPEQASDKNGKLIYNIPKGYVKNYNDPERIMVTWQGDTISKECNFNYNRYEPKDFIAKVEIYTDRSIYRPGQTVYFKAIAYKDYKGAFSVIPNTYFSIYVENESGEDIKKFRLKTNEYGSFADSVQLPKNMVGRFELHVEEDEDFEEDSLWNEKSFRGTDIAFNVEEYKRPTFEVTFNKIKNKIKLNETIKVNGSARAFSDATISNAKVEYQVTRKSKRYWYDNDYRSSEEITFGDTITDTNGQFAIEFNTIPDEDFDPKDLPVFIYDIKATITDINGETHSSLYTVYAGYHAVNITANLPKEINAADKAVIKLETNNLNGEFVPASGEVNIYKVYAPDRIYADRPFKEPEIQTISREEFEKTFPFFPYKTFKDSVSKQAVITKKINTAVSKEIVLKNLRSFESGEYKLVYTVKDTSGMDVTYSRRFTLKKDTDKIPADNKLFDYEIKNKDYTKDGYVEMAFTSGTPIYLSIVGKSDERLIFDQKIELNASKKTVRIPVLKNPSTTMAILLSYVWQNKLYTNELTLTVPGKMEKLSVAAQTLTSKLSPGSPQTWSFTLKGSKKPLEVLASMYDASLDRIVIEDEYLPKFWNDLETYTYSYNYISRYMNSSETEFVSFIEKVKYQMHTKSNDTFYMYGFDLDNTNSIYTYLPKTQPKGLSGNRVSGIVTDMSGMPIPGANVMIEGTSEGVQTDFDGRYTIYAYIGEKLVISFVGMASQTVMIYGSYNNITLKEDAKTLENIIVEAYRTTTRSTSNIAVTTVTSKTIEGRPNANFIQTLQGQVPGLQISTASGQPGAASTVILRGVGSINGTIQPLYIIDGVQLSENDFKNLSEDEIADLSIIKNKDQIAIYGARGANGVIIITTKKGIESLQQIKARKNFNETAFFYPQLRTDKKGQFSFSFTTPEALTEWKLRMIAHNKNAASGYYENTFITQKDLMIVPNMPRFLREKDTIVIIAKVTNLTNEVKTGSAILQLFDAVTMQPADMQMMNKSNLKSFTIPAKANTTVNWKITVPKGMQGVQYKVLAKAGDFSDGEENILPVLPNSIVVTESIPLWVKPNSTKEFKYDSFEKSLSNPAITHIGMTLEYTSNPAWLALQSLPYLMEFEHECAEQVFSRYYANAIAANVIKSSPKIAEVFAAWRKADKPLSKFEQNEELKSIIMAETPWLLDNQSDDEIKNRLALLFDLEKMKNSANNDFKKLQNKQASSGGFPWFEGGMENYYITNHIIAGFGHLNQLGINPENKTIIDIITKKAVIFMDSEFLKDYESGKNSDKRYAVNISFDGLHYLYARSFYAGQYPMPDNIKKITEDYLNSTNKSTAYTKYKWLEYTLYQKGMLALVMNRYGYKDIAKKILSHLKEISSTNEEWGMYWIENKAGWYWYQAPVETQALLIEAFAEINNDTASIDAMKVWLLKNKQNKSWPTTKATTEAVYALLMQGSDWLSVKDNTIFTLGDKKAFDQKLAFNEKEAGTGYVKLQWKDNEIKSGMGTLKIENKSAVPGFGGFYWQRSYEEADKDYVPQQGPLSVSKELFIKSDTASGSLITPLSKDNPIKTGDLVTIRLTVTAKEDMEYLHLKDMRASAFEPVDVISQRKYNNGVSYYQSTRDIATNFFFDSMKKGVYIMEYDVRVNNAGEFSNGIATIQSMYAPEFKGNSKSVRIKVD